MVKRIRMLVASAAQALLAMRTDLESVVSELSGTAEAKSQ